VLQDVQDRLEVALDAGGQQVDEPLVLTNLLGNPDGISDSGISVSKLLVNPLLFLEATGEVYQGNAGLFQSHERSDLSYVGRLRGYRDVNESTNIDIGGSFAHGHNDAGPEFTTHLFTLDATVRYRPLRRAIYKKAIGRTELFWSNRGQPTGDASAFGMFASGEYQVGRRWYLGGRYDWSERAIDPLLRDTSGSAILTYWPSEFSQVRGQYRRTRYEVTLKMDDSTTRVVSMAYEPLFVQVGDYVRVAGNNIELVNP